MEIPSLVTASRMIVEQHAMAVIANNLANASTPAYQAERLRFRAWLAPNEAGAAPGNGVTYVATGQTWRNRASGAFQRTGNPFDLAIGDPTAWFTVRTPRGLRLTRAGAFSLSPTGTLVDQDGDPLLGANGTPITLSPNDTGIAIASDGTLSSRENGMIARIALVRPANPGSLTADGGRLFAANGPTAVVAAPRLMQGMLEGSNVQPVLEVTRMIEAERQFEFMAQFVQAETDRQQQTVQQVATTND